MAKASVSAKAVARWFINRVDRDAGDTITHLKLQKLLYYAQAWYLANFGVRLFDQEMQAWTHGPVVPAIWKQYRDCGWDPIPRVGNSPIGDKKVEQYLEAVFQKYGKFSAKELERMTHADAPWKQTRGDLPLEARCTVPIDDKLMRSFYGSKIGKKWDRKPKAAVR